MATKKKIIMVKPQMIGKLCQATGSKRTTVYNALNYSSFSENAERIRQLALSDYGGLETTKTYL
jgi:hypothetical protein